MKKWALIKAKGLGPAITKVVRSISFGPGHSVYKDIQALQESIKKLDEIIPRMSADPAMQAKMVASRKRYSTLLASRTSHADRLKGEHAKIKQVAGTAAGVAGGAGLVGGTAYLINKAEKPDTGDDFKLAEDWVQGFIVKCASYGIDGQAWLDKVLDEVERTGTIKNAQWGKLLGGVLGGGALYGGSNLYRRYAVADRKRAIEAKRKGQVLIDERNADLKKLMDEEEGNGYVSVPESINRLNKIKAPASPATPAAVPAVKPALPQGRLTGVKPFTVPSMTLSGLPAQPIRSV